MILSRPPAALPPLTFAVIGPDNIYVLRGLEIQVASRETLKHRGVIRLKQISKATKLLITAQHLFVLGEREERLCAPGLLQPRKGGRQLQLQPRRRVRHQRAL
jgi:hypothetical protein